MSTQGGVVFRVGGELCFVPASIAMKLTQVPAIAHIPGSPAELRGVALVDGDMIPVVDLLGAPQGSAMLVCALLGEHVGLVGLEVVATGRFEAAESGVYHGEQLARPFDVAGAIAKVRSGRWGV